MHTAEYLYNKGFTNVYIIDISKQPLKDFKNRNLIFLKIKFYMVTFLNTKDTMT